MAKKATSGKRHVVSDSVLHVVAGVYDELEKMMATESPTENWLREGMGREQQCQRRRLQKGHGLRKSCPAFAIVVSGLQKARAYGSSGTFCHSTGAWQEAQGQCRR